MSQNLHAYRVTNPVSAEQIRDARTAWRAYMGPTGPVAEYQNTHPGNELYASTGLETRFDGFANGAATVPAGLSYRNGRAYLIPKHGETGEPWREVLAGFNRGVPNLGNVLRAWHIPTYVIDADRSMLCHVGIQDYGVHGLFLTIGTALKEDSVLTLVPLSEFYAAKEAFALVSVEGGAAS